MKAWQEGFAAFAATVTATMLLASGGTLIAVSNQQMRVSVQIESITEKLSSLTESMKGLEGRVRNLEREEVLLAWVYANSFVSAHTDLSNWEAWCEATQRTLPIHEDNKKGARLPLLTMYAA